MKNKYFILAFVCILAIGSYLLFCNKELSLRLDFKTFNPKYYHDFYLETDYPVYSSYVQSSEYYVLNEMDEDRNMGGKIENGKYYVYEYLNKELIREEEVDEQEYLQFRDSLYKLMKLDSYFTFSYKDFYKTRRPGSSNCNILKDDCLGAYAEKFDESVDELESVYLSILEYEDLDGHKGKQILLNFEYADHGNTVFRFLTSN
jgi:hypothetical protein